MHLYQIVLKSRHGDLRVSAEIMALSQMDALDQIGQSICLDDFFMFITERRQ